jgi:hypothetical protein
MINDINTLFESVYVEAAIVDKFNEMVQHTGNVIHYTDTLPIIRKKMYSAYQSGIVSEDMERIYGSIQEIRAEYTGGKDFQDTGSDTRTVGKHSITLQHIDADSGINPEEEVDEALSPTERTRRYNRRHPHKVRKYLKNTVKDRAARNRDRKRAVKKYGKSKMKNHDVHHPNGPNGGSWRLAKKDHGPDKKNKNENMEYVYLSELLEGNVPNGPWQLIAEGGAAGHLAHPYEDDTLKFSDVKEMVKRGLVGGLDAEAPVTEKLDGQNIMFTVRDGQVVFARNKGQVKNRGQSALDAAGLRQKFAGRGDIEKAFGNAADDINKAIQALPPEKRDEMFAGGSNFMNVEIIFPDTKNVIPYDKNVLVFHGTVAYDDEGNETGRNIDAGKTLSNELTKVNAQKQATFGLSGPRSISFSDAETAKNKNKMKEYGAQIGRLQREFGLSDKSTIEDYKKAWWTREIDNTGVDWTPEEKKGLISRWALGDKSFKVSDIKDPEKKKFFREFEATELVSMQRTASRPLESVFLRLGADTLRRVTNFLSANNPKLAASLQKELLDTIKTLQNTDDADKLAKLQTQIERLSDIGIDNVIPSEGIVFMYNGKPYKFTGTFAPVNQILGTLKFAKEKAEEPSEEPEKTPTQQPEPTTEPQKPQAEGKPRTVAIFTGRFQPFHAGHYSIYQAMVKKFGKDNVYIASSDKTDAVKSPFNFKDRKQIITTMFDIPDDKVVQVKNTYAPAEILEKLPPNTIYVTAVSQKDAERLGGKYFTPYDSPGEKQPYADKGYFIVAPEMQLTINGKNISGTQLRAVMGDPNITDRAKQEIFTKVYGKFDKKIYDMIVKTTEQSEEARKLTDTHGKSAEKPKIKSKVKPDTTSKKKSKPEEEPKDSSFYEPGETWKTTSGNFGGKNKKRTIKYFKTQQQAQKFATN